MNYEKCCKSLAVFAGGLLFGSAGLKLLSSRDAKKVYTHVTAAALRVKESVMETVTTVEENAADILASARDLNARRAEQEDADAADETEQEAADAAEEAEKESAGGAEE